MAEIEWFEAYTLWFIIPITLLVLVLLAYCIVKLRASANPVPSRTSHNSLIEVIWTVGPVLILLAIAFPSFQLLSAQYNPPEEAKITVKATGNQWNWDYEYQTEEPLSFNSAILADADRAGLGKEDRAVYPRLLAVDNELVVPVNTQVRVLVTAADVMHAFAMPARCEGRRRAGPYQRDLVQCGEGRPLLRPVLRALRQGSRFHADRDPCREPAAVRHLVRRGEGRPAGREQGAMASVEGTSKVADAGSLLPKTAE